MSYDLGFVSEKPVSWKAFEAYFKGRPNYAVRKGQAWYENDDTDVAFSFDWDKGDLTFNLNYFRPHIFGLEAEPEVAGFVATFELDVFDPQGTMEQGRYTREGFLGGWNEGNATAYRSILNDAEAPEPVYTWPEARIQHAWEWNRMRGRVHEERGDEIFVARIMGLAAGTRVARAAIWPPGCAIWLPRVDAVLVSANAKNEDDLAVVAWEEVEPVIAGFNARREKFECYAIEEDSAEVAAFLKKKRPVAKKIQGVRLDEILDREMVEAARAK